jgi:hypothetical protein
MPDTLEERHAWFRNPDLFHPLVCSIFSINPLLKSQKRDMPGSGILVTFSNEIVHPHLKIVMLSMIFSVVSTP